ncbi:MAG: AMP-binding protein, partial [Acetobacteraceae bacterium]|nr:AMP-binding protein [Acetobacteraceae bacterium]
SSQVKSLDDWAPPFGIETHRGQKLVFSTPHLAPETLSWFFDKLEAFRPELMWIWPTAAATLLQLNRRGRRLRMPLVVSSSEQLMPELRREIAEAWGARVIDYYGQAERSCFAASWRQDEYWFQPAYGRVELRPTATDEIVDGHRHVPIVGTGFWNSAMPLVRYDTGDCALVPADCSEGEMEEIALGLRPFSGVAGRREDYILSQAGHRIPGLNQLPREINHLLQMQIVQRRPDCIVIRALVRPGFDAGDRERLMANARAKIPPTITIEIETTDRLESSAQGKTPFIIRHASGAESCAG